MTEQPSINASEDVFITVSLVTNKGKTLKTATLDLYKSFPTYRGKLPDEQLGIGLSWGHVQGITRGFDPAKNHIRIYHRPHP